MMHIAGSVSSSRVLLRASGEQWNSRGASILSMASSKVNSSLRWTLAENAFHLNDPLWTRVAVLRDPLDRFAAAYGDLCSTATNADPTACPDHANRGDVHAVLLALEAIFDKGFRKVRMDFMPQAMHCDLRFVHSAYTFIPYPSLAEGWAAVGSLLKADEVTKAQFSTWSRQIISREGLSSEDLKAMGGPDAADHSALAAAWRSAAANGPHDPNADIVPRIQALYRVDYQLLQEVGRWAVPPARDDQGVAVLQE